MSIRLLQTNDAQALYDFEIANRHWFERSIPSRGEAFYSMAGIEAHIAEYLRDFVQGSMVPALIWQDQDIIGRANLRKICHDKKSGEIGYRIAETHCNQGWASRAVQHLKEVAQSLQLQQIHAFVLVGNLASARVLEKQGFSKEGLRPGKTAAEKACYEFVYQIKQGSMP